MNCDCTAGFDRECTAGFGCGYVRGIDVGGIEDGPADEPAEVFSAGCRRGVSVIGALNVVTAVGALLAVIAGRAVRVVDAVDVAAVVGTIRAVVGASRAV